MDEVHTYTEKRCADVAALIRRLKQHTQSVDQLRCIAASATVESAGNVSAADPVAYFTGEPFSAGNVITESYAPLPESLEPLRRTIAERLATGPMTFKELAENVGAAKKEIINALLPESSQEPLDLVPKLHAFFSQGRAIAACIDPSGPHLNDRGERICPVCAGENRERATFPLVFCRACGQEYWSVAIDWKNMVHQADLDAVDAQGRQGYLLLGCPEIELPDHWLTPTGPIRGGQRGFIDVEPETHTLCPHLRPPG